MSKKPEWKEKLAKVKEGMEEGRLQGTVIKILHGYGFIRHYSPKAPRRDYFFHRSNLEGVKWGDLEAGDLVSFIPKPVGNRESGKCEEAGSVKLEVEWHLRRDRGGKIFRERALK